jgi:hypothetical protein
LAEGFPPLKPEALIMDSERWILLVEDATDESTIDGAGECEPEDLTATSPSFATLNASLGVLRQRT